MTLICKLSTDAAARPQRLSTAVSESRSQGRTLWNSMDGCSVRFAGQGGIRTVGVCQERNAFRARDRRLYALLAVDLPPSIVEQDERNLLTDTAMLTRRSAITAVPRRARLAVPARWRPAGT